MESIARPIQEGDEDNLPHAGKQLNKTTIAESETNDHVGLGNVSSSHVDGAQDKGGEGESGQTKRGRIGKPARFDGFVETWLELSSEGRQTSLSRIDLGQGAVSEASSSFGSFVFGECVGVAI